MEDDTSIRNGWRCIQVGEIKPLRRLLCTNLSNHLRVLMMRGAKNKYWIIWCK